MSNETKFTHEDVKLGSFVRKMSLPALISCKRHQEDAREYHREKLASMWDRGITNGFIFNHHEKMMQLSDIKIDKLNDLILAKS